MCKALTSGSQHQIWICGTHFELLREKNVGYMMLALFENFEEKMHKTVQNVENLEQMCLSLHFSKKGQNCCTLMNSKQNYYFFHSRKGGRFSIGMFNRVLHSFTVSSIAIAWAKQSYNKRF